MGKSNSYSKSSGEAVTPTGQDGYNNSTEWSVWDLELITADTGWEAESGQDTHIDTYSTGNSDTLINLHVLWLYEKPRVLGGNTHTHTEQNILTPRWPVY